MDNKVEFKTYDGLTLRGYFLASKSPKAATIILPPGLTYLKEAVYSFAKAFNEAGANALAYDNRSFGSSDGIPRQEYDMDKFAEDLTDAVTYLTLRPGVDAEKIGVWGGSHGGTIAIACAASDPRVKVVAAHVPFVSGENDADKFPEGYLHRAIQERIDVVQAGSNDKTPVYVKTFASTREEAEKHPYANIMGIPRSFDTWIAGRDAAAKNDTVWENKLSLQSLWKMSKFEPATWIHRISPRPLLYVADKYDEFMHYGHHLHAFHKAREPKFLVEMDSDHLGTYRENLDASIQYSVDFFKRHLLT